MFQLEEDEGGSGDAGDGRRVEADPAEGLEGDLQQGAGAFGHAVHAADRRVERLVFLGEFATLGLLDRVTEAAADVLVTEVGQVGAPRVAAGAGVRPLAGAILRRKDPTEGPHLSTNVTYTAVLDVKWSTAEHLARLLGDHRIATGTRLGRRTLGCFRRAVIVLRCPVPP